MAQPDVDKILEELKQKKTETSPPASKTAENQGLSRQGKETLQQFMNNNMPREKEKDEKAEKNNFSRDDDNLFKRFPDDGYANRTSEDYLDDNFMKFFTQNVVNTKSAEKTNNLRLKKKKGGIFRKRYITDSLSLNMDTVEDVKNKDKAQPRDGPIVKTARDVRMERQFDTGESEKQIKKSRKTVPEEKSRPEKIIKDDLPSRQKEVLSPVRKEDGQKEKIRQAVSEISAQNTGRNKSSSAPVDADDLARQILRQRKDRPRKPEKDVKKDISLPEKPEYEEQDITEDTTVRFDRNKRGEKGRLKKKQAEILESSNEEEEAVPENAKSKNETPLPGTRESIVENIYTTIFKTQNEAGNPTDETTYVSVENEIKTEEGDSSDTVETEEDENKREAEEEETEETSEPEFPDYNTSGEFFSRPDANSDDILTELLDFRKTLSLRMALGFVCGAILIYLASAAKSGLPLPTFIDPWARPLYFYIFCRIVYGVCFVAFLPTVISGFSSFGKVPAPDSLLSLGAVLALVQPIVMAVFSKNIFPDQATVFSGYVAIALAFNAMGKKIATNTIIKNLTLANVPDGINAGYIIKDEDAVRTLARSLDEKVPHILVSRKTGAIQDFVRAGFSEHPGDARAAKDALLSYVVTGLCFILGTFLSKSPLTGLFCAVGASAIQIPLASTLVSSIPDALMQKSLEQVGALVNGRQGIDRLSKTTHVNFDARHLFPKGTVILHGIKTFERERLDLAIMYAASVLIEKCQVLKPVFMDVINGRQDILYPIDSCEYIEGRGYVAWIDNSRVIIGNRTLMEKYDVDMPPLSLEAKFVKEGRKPVYLSVGGKLFGMFVFSYHRNDLVRENIGKLIDRGVNIILSSDDFNIDPALVEQVYNVPRDCVTVLNPKEAELMRKFTSYSPQSEACLAHLDSLPSLTAGFCGAESAESAERLCSTIRGVGVVLAAILALIFTYFGTISSLPLLPVLLLGFGYMGLTVVGAFAKKY